MFKLIQLAVLLAVGALVTFVMVSVGLTAILLLLIMVPIWVWWKRFQFSSTQQKAKGDENIIEVDYYEVTKEKKK